jgi:5-methyltetrahydrofolate--homocysteine methyltransferase
VKAATKIKKIIGERCLVLDGATGTELQRRGMPSGVCPETWCIDNPRVISGIHEDYRKAGADVIYTCTFGANRVKLAQYGRSDVESINRELALLTRRAVGPEVLVAGDIGPMGRFVEPFGDVLFDEAVDIFREQISGLIAGGVDLLVIETMMDIQEARAALLAARESTDLFTMVTMTFEAGERTLNGTEPAAALVTLQSLGADAVGCNCSTGPAEMVGLASAMNPFRAVPLVAKPNAGMPQLQSDGSAVFTMTPEEFAGYGKSFVENGVGLLGGCCGTTPDHIVALKKALNDARPPACSRTRPAALSSCRKAVVIDRGGPLMIVGERINPTGRPSLQEELRSGRTDLVSRMGREQERQGADLLDVNVGVPGIDQKKAMADAVKALSVASSLPLVIDASDPDVIETGLRLYPGRALINSISGETSRMERLLGLARYYGAMFILLPLTEGGVPETADERKSIVRNIYREARRHGLSKNDIVVDGLVMTVSSNQAAPAETLKTVEWTSQRFRCATLLGLSNVSFGLPERPWLNAAFLAMAQSRGLTMAIADPAGEELMNIKTAGDVLNGRDTDAERYCSRFAGPSGIVKQQPDATSTLPERIHRAVMEGSRDEIVSLLERSVADGKDPQKLLSESLIPAITDVGDCYEKKELFLPQLIAAAETMKRGVAYLEPLIKKDDFSADGAAGTIVMATVEGDIHDIGKNIVILMLRNHGYTVVDLGKNVSARRVVEEARRSRADLVGLSALMTTTVIRMEETIELARREGVNAPFLAGGAVVTPSWASSIGAHYAKDGVQAVRTAEKLLKKSR